MNSNNSNDKLASPAEGKGASLDASHPGAELSKPLGDDGDKGSGEKMSKAVDPTGAPAESMSAASSSERSESAGLGGQGQKKAKLSLPQSDPSSQDRAADEGTSPVKSERGGVAAGAVEFKLSSGERKYLNQLEDGFDLMVGGVKDPQNILYSFLVTKLKPSASSALLIYPNTAAARSALEAYNVLGAELTGGVAASGDDASIASDIVFTTCSDVVSLFEEGKILLRSFAVIAFFDVDRIIRSSFEENVSFLLQRVHRECQKLLFSSKKDSAVESIAKEFLRLPSSPQKASPAQPPADSTNIGKLDQLSFLCATPEKFKILLGLLRRQPLDSTLIFANTRLTATWLHSKLKGNDIDAINLADEAGGREDSLAKKSFSEAKVGVVVATDNLGSDLAKQKFSQIINFDLPKSGERYVERLSYLRADADQSTPQVRSLVCEEFGSAFEVIRKFLGEQLPKPVWPESSMLDTVDKGKNPFFELFQGQREVRSPRQRPQGSRPAERERERKGGRGAEGRIQRGERDRGAERPRHPGYGAGERRSEHSSRGKAHSRGEARSSRPPRQDSQAKGRGRQTTQRNQFERRREISRARAAEGRKAPVAAKKKGLIMRILGGIFGK